MDIKEVYTKLCYYDKRNPENSFDAMDEEQKPRDNCFCDNCFYGRDKLAVEILRLNELVNEMLLDLQ